MASRSPGLAATTADAASKPPPITVEAVPSIRRQRRSLNAHADAGTEDLEALEAWISIEVWTRLRQHQGLSRPRALRTIKRVAHTLAAAMLE